MSDTVWYSHRNDRVGTRQISEGKPGTSILEYFKKWIAK